MCVGFFESCFCFRDIRRAVVAIGVFSLVTSIIQIITTVAVFTAFSQNSTISFSPQTADVTTYELYIALAGVDFLVALAAVLVLYGNERTNQLMARCYFYPLLILLPPYVIYESGVNIYYFYNQFNSIYKAPLSGGSSMGYIIVPLVYWVIKDIIEFIGFIFLIVRIQNFQPAAPVIQYANTGGGCQGGCEGPTLHAPMPPPMMQLPSFPVYNGPPTTACSGGCSAGSHCPKCNKRQTQPMYGYSGMNSGFPSGWQSAGMQGNNVTKNGWVTSVYNSGY